MPSATAAGSRLRTTSRSPSSARHREGPSPRLLAARCRRAGRCRPRRAGTAVRAGGAARARVLIVDDLARTRRPVGSGGTTSRVEVVVLRRRHEVVPPTATRSHVAACTSVRIVDGVRQQRARRRASNPPSGQTSFSTVASSPPSTPARRLPARREPARSRHRAERGERPRPASPARAPRARDPLGQQPLVPPDRSLDVATAEQAIAARDADAVEQPGGLGLPEPRLVAQAVVLAIASPEHVVHVCDVCHAPRLHPPGPAPQPAFRGVDRRGPLT